MLSSSEKFSLAARLPRDAPAETTTSAFDEWKDKLEESLKGLKDEADKTFTKENVNVSISRPYIRCNAVKLQH